MHYYFLNNKIVPAHKAVIPLSDIGLMRAYAVFDFTRTFNSKPFFLREHLQRLMRSAKELSIKVPYTIAEIERIAEQLLKKNKFLESTIKVGVTGGTLVSSLDFNAHEPTFFIMIDELHEFPKRFFIEGIKLLTIDYQRPLHISKTIDYAMAVKEQLRCNREGAFEILYAPNGYITESATSNFFMFKGNTLITPKDNILLGVTRNFVLRLARKQFTVIERPIRLSELRSADEAFLTATKKDILPVVKVNGVKIGSGRVGQRTQYLTEQYFAYIDKHYGRAHS